jgi:glycosyltransferase involved in cell wall biosynthesis
MKPELSVILPIHNQADHIAAVLRQYYARFKKRPWEIILVPNACQDDSARVCRKIAARHANTRVVENPEGGWGLSVRVGLQKARGRFLCYTNSARTDPATIVALFEQFKRDPGCLAKVHRRLRGNWFREWGSWLYNLECRWLLGLSTWDVNGTPKIFSASLFRKLSLRSTGDLLDAELLAQCRYLKIPLLEMPLRRWVRHGGKSLMSFKSALRLYQGPFRFMGKTR